MKLLLDAHLSGKRAGSAPRRHGYDVRAADDPELEGLEDGELLALAAREGRVLITANVRDFVPLVADWAAGGRSHAGVILIPRSIRHEQCGVIVAAIQRLLDSQGPDQQRWIDRVEWLRRT